MGRRIGVFDRRRTDQLRSGGLCVREDRECSEHGACHVSGLPADLASLCSGYPIQAVRELEGGMSKSDERSTL